MSRNIGQRDCNHCGHAVVLTSGLYTATPEKMGVYAKEFAGRVFADAECPACLAQYIAWDAVVGELDEGECPHTDLSYRNSFNDEPDERDLPRYKIELRYVRVGVYGQDPENKYERGYMRLGEVK